MDGGLSITSHRYPSTGVDFRSPIFTADYRVNPTSASFSGSGQKSLHRSVRQLTLQIRKVENMEATLKDWLGSFWNILIRPSQSTFFDEAQKAQGKTGSAVGWILFLTIFIHLYNYVAFNYVYPIYVIISSFILLPLDIFILTFCMDTICRKVFHRRRSYYDEFLYLWVVIFVISQVIIVVLSLIPAIRDNYLSWVLFLYPIGLLTVAVKSLTELKIWQAAITVVLSVILASLFLICGPVFLFILIGTVPGVL